MRQAERTAVTSQRYLRLEGGGGGGKGGCHTQVTEVRVWPSSSWKLWAFQWRSQDTVRPPDFFAMLRSLPSAIDGSLDTLYEPNAVFSQFLGSASMTFFLSFPFLASSSCLAYPCVSCLSLLFVFFLSLPCLFCSFIPYPLSYVFIFFSFFPIELRL